jgi:hypothetical protein
LVSVQADYSDKYLAECGIPSTTNIHMFRVEKVDLLGNPESGGTFLSTAIDIVKCVYKITVAQAKGQIVKKLLTSCQKMSKSCQKVFKKCQKDVKKAVKKLLKFLVYIEKN